MIEYVDLPVARLWKESDRDPKRFRHRVALQVQGGAVEFDASKDVEIVPFLIAYDVVRRLCPEAIVRTQEGDRLLLFTETEERDVIRPQEIFTDLMTVDEDV